MFPLLISQSSACHNDPKVSDRVAVAFARLKLKLIMEFYFMFIESVKREMCKAIIFIIRPT